jgi:hypothetical protein
MREVAAFCVIVACVIIFVALKPALDKPVIVEKPIIKEVPVVKEVPKIVEKEVIREVPKVVEKEVIKEVPVYRDRVKEVPVITPPAPAPRQPMPFISKHKPECSVWRYTRIGKRLYRYRVCRN